MIELEEVTKIYPGAAQPAVDRISLTVPAGEICVFIGPSGCGKTTLMRLINRLIPISAGTIRVEGKDVTALDPIALRRHIGYVIQQVGLFPHMTVRDNIATVPKLLGWDKARIDRRVDELLSLVNLEPKAFRDRYPRQLSGGQAQRIGVARAMAADPPIMLMDEPFGAIDPINREVLQDEFLRIQEKLRKTIIFVTHDINEAIKMGRHIALLKDGKLVQSGRARRTAEPPGRRVRQELRRLRPGAQAPQPAQGARRHDARPGALHRGRPERARARADDQERARLPDRGGRGGQAHGLRQPVRPARPPRAGRAGRAPTHPDRPAGPQPERGPEPDAELRPRHPGRGRRRGRHPGHPQLHDPFEARRDDLRREGRPRGRITAGGRIL